MSSRAVVIRSTFWLNLTALGDSAVLLPCMALIALWLALPASSRALAWRWLALAACAISVVAISKLAYMGWRVSLGLPDFTGLSGHAALAATVWPSMGALLGGRRNPRWQAIGWFIGLLLALLVSVSRLVLHAHSASEAWLGSLLGALLSGGFLWRFRHAWKLPESGAIAVLSLLPVVLMFHGYRFPSEQWLGEVAAFATGHHPYTRSELHRVRH